MKRYVFMSFCVFTTLVLLNGCKTEVDRVAVDKQVDLSGRWNDTDSQLVSAEMIADIAKRPWIEDFKSKHGRKPVVIVGTIRNKSSEHIETEPFTKDLERELINNGRLTFVANKRDRGELRNERLEQQNWASAATQKRLAAETGADFMLQGTINTIIDQEGKKSVKFYQVDLEMVNLETNEKVWSNGKKIKKIVKKSSWKL